MKTKIIATDPKAACIYGAYVTHPDGTKSCLYIGASKVGLRKRSQVHMHDSIRPGHTTTLGHLMVSAPKAPLTFFTLQEFDQELSKQDLHTLELAWISYFKSMGVTILNRMRKSSGKTNVNHQSGVEGIHYSVTSRKWQLRLSLNGYPRKHIGYYTNLSDAIAAKNKCLP
jgi:hypothetical protein